jgi:uncharacterized protein (DUF1330 family)
VKPKVSNVDAVRQGTQPTTPWQPSRLVVLEFEDLATAKRWYESEVYQEAKKLSEGTAHLRVVAVEGVD